MAGFVVADLDDAGVGGVGATEGGEVCVREELDGLLVEGEDDPFGGEEVLE